jgi:nicotinamidase-related amidase
MKIGNFMKSIYVVLDMQNDLVNADGINGQSSLGIQVRTRRIIENTRVALEKARDAGLMIGFVRVGFSQDYRECPSHSPVFSGAPKAGIFALGTWGAEIHPELECNAGDIQIIKHRVSPFYGTSLELQLRTLGIGRIYCSGVTTQAVVQATVRDAHDRDFDVIVLEDCCAAHSKEEHNNSMQSLSRFCNAATSSSVNFDDKS